MNSTKELKDRIEQLEAENAQLVSRNLQLSEQLCMWYELRQRVNWLKEEMEHDRRLIDAADRTNDAELLAAMEKKLEQDKTLLTPEFGIAQLSALLGVSQQRLTRLFRNTIYKSADDYLDFLRLLRALELIREHPEYGIVSVSEASGYNSVRTFQRRMSEAVGMTPVEFRIMVEKSR